MKAFLDWKHILWAQPLFFLLFLIIPFMIWWEYYYRKNANPIFRLTTLSGIKTNSGFKSTLRPAMFILRVIGVIALIIALARPQSTNVTEKVDTNGIDIMMGIDVSGSMLAEDFKPNRIEAAKRVALDFVEKRPNDRIGMVIFAGESLTVCPITIDHEILEKDISEIKSGQIVDGTSIGMGLATMVKGLRYSKAKSKVMILMTDGVNNTGLIDPLTALEIVKTYHIKCYTIGIGTMGQAIIPVQTPMGIQKQMMEVEIDEPLLKKIAAETGGRYFRATGNKSMEDIYAEIDKLEKTAIEVSSHKRNTDLFFPFALIAASCITLEMLLRYTVFRSLT